MTDITATSIALLSDKFAKELWPNEKNFVSVAGLINNLIKIYPRAFNLLTQQDYETIVTILSKRGYKPSTINRHMNVLTKLLRKAMQEGIINNVLVYRRLKENDDQLRYLSFAEEDLLLKQLDHIDTRYKILSMFLIETGITMSEAISLKWRDIKDGYVHISENQHNLSRALPLTDRAKTVLSLLDTTATTPFCGIDPVRFRSAWRNAIKNSALEGDSAIVPTVLRHTCASRLILMGVDIRIVQNWLGNRNYKTMLRYEKLLDQSDFTTCHILLNNYRLQKNTSSL